MAIYDLTQATPQQPEDGQATDSLSAGRVATATQLRRVLVVNAKGGCGKTTIATNLASYYASQKRYAALFDYDPQGSSMQWLACRGEEHFPIHGVAAFRKPTSGTTRTFQMRMPSQTERVILDAPAGLHGMPMIDLVREADTIIIPVLPSPIDIHAASHFIKDLLLVAKVRARGVRVGVVANRVRKNTKVYHSLRRFLDSLRIPFVAYLRDTQNYVQSSEEGMGIHELHANRIQKDRAQWKKLVNWIEGDDGGGFS
ncbi:MAG: AAA family ATPase [Chromatiales bacterium]|nr:AAA family ATPase [Chromatiales bacterium]